MLAQYEPIGMIIECVLGKAVDFNLGNDICIFNVFVVMILISCLIK